jgi:hypothetical protein
VIAPSATAGATSVASAAGAVGTAGMGVVTGAAGASVPFPGDSHPGPGGPSGPPAAPAPPAPDVPDPAPGAPPAPDAPPDGPRPVATRPGAGGGASGADAALAVRGLAVRDLVPLAAARADGIAVTFVPRPGSIVAEARLYARRSGGRRLVVSFLVPARSGRRTTVRLRARSVRRGAYEVSVRAGAGHRTLGPAVTARVRIV